MYRTEREHERERPARAADQLEAEAKRAPVLDAREVVRLQATAGNQAVQRLLGARPASVRTLQREVTTGAELTADKAYAHKVIDPLLTQYFIGQSLSSLDDDRERRKDARIKELIKGLDVLDEKFVDAYEKAKATATAEYEAEEPVYAPMKAAYQEGDRISRGLDLLAEGTFKTRDFVSKLEYWRAKAKRVGDKKRTRLGADEEGRGGRLPLWCDHATALVVDLLSAHPAFKSSLDVIKQGDPHVSGHWYVLANRERDIEYGRKLTENEFVIDLWGAILRELPTAVLDAQSSYPLADYAGILNLIKIEKLESVMTVRQGKTEGDEPASEVPAAAELIEDEVLAPEDEEDFDALLARLTAGEPLQTRSPEELLEAALSGGEGMQDLDDLLSALGEPKGTGAAAASSSSEGES
jgi:hypothetical protein